MLDSAAVSDLCNRRMNLLMELRWSFELSDHSVKYRAVYEQYIYKLYKPTAKVMCALSS